MRVIAKFMQINKSKLHFVLETYHSPNLVQNLSTTQQLKNANKTFLLNAKLRCIAVSSFVQDR